MALGRLCALMASMGIVQAEVPSDAPDCSTVGAGYNDPIRREKPSALTANANDCQLLCMRTVYCERFTFYNNSGGCWLQGNNWTEVESPYIISGPVLCPGQARPGDLSGFTPLDAAALKIWQSVVGGNATIKAQDSIGGATIETGMTNEKLIGRVVVIKDINGKRAACSPLSNTASGTLVSNVFTKYPGYIGPLDVSGYVTFNKGSDPIKQDMRYALAGTDKACGKAKIAGVKNACGIAIHEGLSCLTADNHLYNYSTEDADPWDDITYTTLGQTAITDLERLGAPTAFAQKLGFEDTYVFTWDGGKTNVTVKTNSVGGIEVSDVAGLDAEPPAEVKSKEIGDGSTSEVASGTSSSGSSGFPWWAWLLIALAVIFLLGLLYYSCSGMGDKKKKKKSGKSKTSTSERDLEKAPLVENASSPAASAGQQVIPSVASPVPMVQPAQAEYVSVGQRSYVSGGQPIVMSQAQPMVMSGAQPMVMSVAQPMVMSGAQPMVMSGAQPMVMSGAQPAVNPNDLFTQLDRDGDGFLSPEELASVGVR
eukprot:TRINITY_DN4478_c0_g4_i1.p1 TRINITY_DN4478_c0_g4~~TRINITY_DN4478_c0_g4_i1.p1  ORF type:complete len:538 (-),score=97.14 TRINITY_DN4478_c0_g4_i1:72-1685(-)